MVYGNSKPKDLSNGQPAGVLDIIHDLFYNIPGDVMKEFVECPICGNSFKSITKNHLLRIHNISLETFLEMYPGFDLESEELKHRRSVINSEINSRESVKNLRSKILSERHKSGKMHPGETMKTLWSTRRDDMIQRMLEAQKRPEVIERKSEIMKERWKDESFKEKVFSRGDIRIPKISKASRDMWESKRDFIVSRMLEAQKRPEVIERKSEIMKERRKDGDYNQRHRERMIELFNNDEWVKNLSKSQKGLTFHSKWYDDFHVRSSYELLVCETLEILNIPYEYEKKKFKYSYQGEEHLYVVDFYIPELELYLEVKPKVFENDELVQVKFHSVKDMGLNIIFIDEDVIFDIDEFRQKLYTSTTIQKV
jgi:hypothetical protein